jgi:glycosyltransferase involved in cell wall biosynthesis
VSFIVLSYNYEAHIVKTLQSILDQTFCDFEVVVVDDASSDRSCEVVRSFVDPRIRLFVNEQNLGGAASYNRAVSLCRGEYLVNLDADDWIDSRKTEVQFRSFEQDPSLDILGTYVSYVDSDGRSHSQSAKFEAWTNQPRDLNLVSNWIVTNFLCRSSTMVRRSVHERIGLDEPAMVRAPDYELWTRALYKGCRFGVIQEPLTFYRLHSRSVTYGDPRGAFLEICYLLLKNIMPIIEKRATFDCFCKIIDWIVANDQFVACQPDERYRLLGAMITSPASGAFPTFREIILGNSADPMLASAGRRLLVAFTLSPGQQYAERLLQDIDKYIGARDYWHTQSDNFEREYRKLEAHCQEQERLSMEAEKGQSQSWRTDAYRSFRNLARKVLQWARKKNGQWKREHSSE